MSETRTADLAGLVEGIVHLHGEHATHRVWTGLFDARYDSCGECSGTWPCRTLLMVCEVLGQEPPPSRRSGCGGLAPHPDERDLEGECELPAGHDGPCAAMPGSARIQPGMRDPRPTAARLADGSWTPPDNDVPTWPT